MVRCLRLVSTCILLALAASGVSRAQDIGVTLSEAHIEGFIGVMPQLQIIAQRHDSDDDVDTLASDPASAIANTAKAMAELNALLQSNGFQSVEEWGQVATAIAMAYNWLSEADDPERSLTEQIAIIKAEPSLTSAQKEPIIASLESQRDIIREMKPPAQNLEIVARYRDKIARVLED